MRVTFNFLSMKNLQNVQTSLNKMTAASDKVQNGRGLLRPEDNPVNYVSAFNVQRMIDDTKQFERNAQNASTWITNADNELQRAIDLVTKAKNEFAIAGANASQSAQSRKAIAGDVKNVYNSLMDVGNANYLGRYIFAGQKTDSQPFAVQENEVSAVTSKGGVGGDVLSTRVYGDMPELDEGIYTVKVNVLGDLAEISVEDEFGREVLIDSTGSDETAAAGNVAGKKLVVRNEPGKVLNLGRGAAIRLPDASFSSLELSFQYKPGSEVNYFGDDNEISTRLGFAQDVSINVPGRDIFLEKHRTIQGTRYNSINNIPLTETSKMTLIDSANVLESDSIVFTGTDHNGYRVDAARVLGVDSVQLNMINTTDAERSLMFGYGGKYYELVIPEDSYDNMEELASVVKRQLKYTQYAGTEKRAGGVVPTSSLSGSNYTIDLSGEIEVHMDGDRLLFTTVRGGDHVELSVTGQQHNRLGFEDLTVTGEGRDNTFEIGYNNFVWTGGSTLQTNHTGVDMSTGVHTFYVNGQQVNVSINTATATMDSVELAIDRALQNVGLGYEVSAHVITATGTLYDISFTMQNTNYDRNVYLATNTVDALGVTTDFQMVVPRPSSYPDATPRRVDDMLTFVEELYDNAVSAELENGKLVVKDIRAGQSNLTLQVFERNEGIGYTDGSLQHVLLGNYTGQSDDRWDFTISVTDPGNGQRDVSITVEDSRGNELLNTTYANYHGQQISLPYNVDLAMDATNFTTLGVYTFSADMKAGGSLSFGDMNVVKEGENVNIYRSLRNLQTALDFNIPEQGIQEPSTWTEENLGSSASPYFEGEFRGNFNDIWTYEVLSEGNSTQFYLQQEHEISTGAMRLVNTAAQTLSFDISIYDNVNDEFPVVFPLTLNVNATAGFANPTEMRDAVIDAVNSNTVLHQYGVRAETDGSKVVIKSGRGTQEITLTANDINTQYAMGLASSSQVGVFPPELTLTANATIDVSYYEAGVWNTIAVTVPAATYADTAAVATELSLQLGIIDPDFSATVQGSALKVNAGGAKGAYYVSGDAAALLGFPATDAGLQRPDKNIPMDLSGLSIEQRTLTFRWDDGATEQSAPIVLSELVYDNIEAMMAEVNTQMAAAGVDTEFEVVKLNDQQFGFRSINALNTSYIVEGDYSATLGFFKTGDELKMKVSGSDGKMVQEVTINTANKPEYVSDGVMLGFDKGSLFATDSFTGGLGSGINYEIPILDKAENQMMQALTTVGTRQNRIESVLNFQETLEASNETIKARYLQASESDITASITEFSMSQQAYEFALSATSRMLQISILDFLR